MPKPNNKKIVGKLSEWTEEEESKRLELEQKYGSNKKRIYDDAEVQSKHKCNWYINFILIPDCKYYWN